MKIHILFGHRYDSYPGEYAPEALEVMTDNCMCDNPDWLFEKKDKYRDSDEFDILKIMVLNVDDESFDRLFFETEQLTGKLEEGN